MHIDEDVISRRDSAIARLGLLERAGDPGLAALCRLTAYVCGCEAAAVHIIDEALQRRIASANVPLGEHPREDSMCRLVVDDEQRLYCADATLDPRFGYSSFVQGPEPVRFYLSVPLETSDGVIVGTLCAFDTVAREVSEAQMDLVEDLARQVVSQIELQRIALDLGHIACHDPLTGVANRLVLSDRLAQAFARRLRHGGRTLIAVIDINDFKTINDRHGHGVGDQVLVHVARRLAESVRAEDTVARVGGDEFVIMVELEEDYDFGPELVMRIETAIKTPFMGGEEPMMIGVSVGCAYANPGEEISSALARADQAMFHRKLTSFEPPAPTA
jgi:diguanylate cyclase (GGDEF)-like protein